MKLDRENIVLVNLFLLTLMVISFGPAQSEKMSTMSVSKKGLKTPESCEKMKKSPEDLAIEIVFKRKDVQDWQKQFDGPGGTSRSGGKVASAVEGHIGKVYTVHLFEDLPNHTATFNWYDVNIETGEVIPQF